MRGRGRAILPVMTLFSIGRRPQAEGLVDLLLECHQRIRAFTALAAQVGRRGDLPDAEVIDACLRCERYFTEALPLHVRDEEESLLPRLRGRSPAVDEALAAMHRQHDEHLPLLAPLLAALREARGAPADTAPRARLAAAAAAAEAAFDEHLAIEERTLFPAARALPADQQAAVVAELRARRRPPQA